MADASRYLGGLPAGDGQPNWLFLDLNSFFASVEQQERPELRGRPVAVVPADTEFTCAIAASYPAKACGVKTGTLIRDARRMCPGLVCVPARHELYVRYHHRIVAEVDRHIPVTQIASIDEMACELVGEFRRPEAARALAGRIKEGLRRRVGECLTCSIGIAATRLLAKVASDLEKPDGLVLLPTDELPGRLASLELHDLPGIGPNLERRLWRAGIDTFLQLWNTAPKQLRAIWHSVEGERFWYRLHGVEIPDTPTRRGMVTHSHVLEPALRPAALAGEVARRLVLKAAGRLRRLGYYASRLDLFARVERGPRWDGGVRFEPACDNHALLAALAALWDHLLAEVGPVRFLQVGVALHGLLSPEQMRQLELFPGGAGADAAACERRAARERLSAAMDQLNARFGRDSVTLGLLPGDPPAYLGSRIAFTRVPGEEDFDRARPPTPLIRRGRAAPRGAR